MFKKETVFILGAGASYPYGYPLGKGLIKKIIENIEKDEILIPYTMDISLIYNRSENKYIWNKFSSELKTIPSNFCNQKPLNFSNPAVREMEFYHCIDGNHERRNFIKIKINEIDAFSSLRQTLLDFDPVSIDAFLRDKQSQAEAGKIMIIYSLLKYECQKKFELLDGIPDDKGLLRATDGSLIDNWYSYLINDLFSGCSSPEDILSNNLNIITFNYDLSLEYCLFNKLSKTEFLSKENMAQKFINDLKENRIMHVYGKIYTDDVVEAYGEFCDRNKNRFGEFVSCTKRFLKAKTSMDNIKLINEDRKGEYSEIKKAIKEASEIIIIGFGFDRDNLSVLGFPEDLNKYRSFLHEKKLKYMDYGGQMKNLGKQFDELNKAAFTTIIRSEAILICNAYQNDFKIHLYQ